MATVYALSHRSIDQLEDEIISHSQRMNTQEYEFLVLVREFDIRQGWKAYHFNHCADWLNMKCGIEVATGREKVRVAKALFDLPRVAQAFSRGELSYSKARSLTRVATPLNEAKLLDYALEATAGQVQDYCVRLRNADRCASTIDVNHIHRNRYLSRTLDGKGRMTISVEVTQEAGELVMQAIELAMAEISGETKENPSRDVSALDDANDSDIDTDRTEEADESLFARQADALVSVAQAYLSGGTERKTSTADHYQVTVHVDEAALREAPSKNARSDLPLESVRRLCCDGAIIAVTEDEKGDPLNLGRKHRVVQPALRRALVSRDKTCRYPGCGHTRWLDAHHVKHWIDGGETSLNNAVLLCSRHHRLLHEGGYTIKKNFKGEWYFETAGGKVLAAGHASSM